MDSRSDSTTTSKQLSWWWWYHWGCSTIPTVQPLTPPSPSSSAQLVSCCIPYHHTHCHLYYHGLPQHHRHQLSSPSLTAFESLLFRLLVKFWGFVSAKAGFLQGTSFALDYAGTPSKFLDCFEWLSSQAEHNWPKQQWSVLDGFWQWRNLPLYDNELIDVKLSENILDTENFAKVWIQKQI